MNPELPAGWTLAASAFNWTPDVIRAERTATDIAVGIVEDGIASTIELEPGQLWRSFPAPLDREVDELRERLDAAHGRVSIVGASLDDWIDTTHHRTDAERLEFLRPQLQAAHRVGASGVRLPVGQAGRGLLEQILPLLADLDLVLYEEIQGQQSPTSPATAPAIRTIADLDDPHLRLLVDISMLMPALPPSYLERLDRAGIPHALLARLEHDWQDPSTGDAVVEHLRSGAVPASIHAMYMNLLVRFGRSPASELRDILPLVGAFHLKFWDLDDADARVSAPIRDLGAVLAGTPFMGTLTSEWGGHEWLEEADASDMTRRHLALARGALVEGGLVAAGIGRAHHGAQ
ncbi:restriction endonuclease subunit R [Agromyces bracchium]|uniref:Restriction endonuclease subunit R n=1 Tax=Agromyces bracchium TaxID=88376 RepID=A0A6I3MGD5_9MICO|nr:restriction endonuclease subunit R [Agromyces bracchium]